MPTNVIEACAADVSAADFKSERRNSALGKSITCSRRLTALENPIGIVPFAEA